MALIVLVNLDDVTGPLELERFYKVNNEKKKRVRVLGPYEFENYSTCYLPLGSFQLTRAWSRL